MNEKEKRKQEEEGRFSQPGWRKEGRKEGMNEWMNVWMNELQYVVIGIQSASWDKNLRWVWVRDEKLYLVCDKMGLVLDEKMYLVCDKMGLVMDEKMYLVWAGVGWKAVVCEKKEGGKNSMGYYYVLDSVVFVHKKIGSCKDCSSFFHFFNFFFWPLLFLRA